MRFGIRLYSEGALIKSTRTGSERFCLQTRYGKCGNTVCISHFSYRRLGAKDPLSSRKRFIHTELQLKSLEKILIARRARSSYETCFVISFLINHKTGSAIRRCLPD